MTNNSSSKVETPSSENGSVTEGINVTSRYRRFIISGIARSLVTRVVSLVFIGIIYNTVAKEVLDKSVILSIVELLIVKICLFGLPFALTRQSIVKKFSEGEIYSNATLGALIGGVVSMFFAFLISVFIPMTSVEIALYMTVVGLNLVVEVIYVVNNCFLDSDISLISQAIYSILTSITVPLFYVIHPSLVSIIISWLFSMVISLLAMKKHLFKLSFRQMNINTYTAIIKFGLPVYFSQSVDNLIQKVDLFVIYLFFPVGDTSLYYYVMKIAVIVRQLFANVFSGMFPLLAKLYSRGNHEKFYKLVNSAFRLSLFAAVIFYTPFIFQAPAVLLVILRIWSPEGTLILKLILFGYMIRSSAYLFDPVLKTEGRRKFVSLAILFGNFMRVVSIALLIRFGSSGLASALIIEGAMIMLFYLFTLASRFDGAGRYVRISLFIILSTLLAVLLPSGVELIAIALSSLLFLLLLSLILIALKPLYSDDWEVIERIIGKKFSSKVSRFSSLFIST